MEIFLFFPPLLSSKVEFILGFSRSLSLSLPRPSFLSPSLFLWSTLAVQGTFSCRLLWKGVCIVGNGWPQEHARVRRAVRRDPGLLLKGTGAALGILETQVGFPAALTGRPPCPMAVPSLVPGSHCYPTPPPFLKQVTFSFPHISPNPECLKHGVHAKILTGLCRKKKKSPPS